MKNESGMALVTALLILVGLTLLAVTAMTNTTINTMIAGNDYRSGQEFYASEGAAELALASLTGLISDTNPAIMQMGIHNIENLLGFDSDGDGTPDGDISSILGLYLNTQDFYGTYCNPDGLEDSYIHSVRIEDDQDEAEINLPDDPLNDINGTFYLISCKYEKGNPAKRIDQVSYMIEQVLINYDGAVNLINDDIVLSMDSSALIDGKDEGDNVTKDGMVTTDTLNTELSDYGPAGLDLVRPNGVIQKPDVLANPSIQELHEVRDLLSRQVDPVQGGQITINADHIAGAENNPDAEQFYSSTIKYIKGELIVNADLNGILIVEEYLNPNGDYSCGLTINKDRKFSGLIILLPRNTGFNQDVNVRLEEGAEINGVLIASNQADPGNPHRTPVPKIYLNLQANAGIQHKSSSIMDTGLERRFTVLKRTYLPQ
ncbi:MAG: PilX N-terminal domain-containing pilus assembly protein [bacterium]